MCNYVGGWGVKGDDMSDGSKWDNGSWSISGEGDYVYIQGVYNQRATVVGGDFEGLLMALCSAFDEGVRKGEAAVKGK